MNWKHLVAALAFWFGAAAAPVANEFANWVEYRSPDGAFTVSFPSKPIVGSEPVPGSTPAITISYVKTANSAFVLDVSQMAVAPGVVLPNPLDFMTRPNMEGRVIEYVRVISLGSVPGRELLSQQQGAWIHERFYWHDNKFYNLRTIARTKNEHEQADQYFFESFRFNAK